MSKKLLVFIIAGLFIISCTRYERQVSPFKMPDAYPNVKQVMGAKIAAVPYHDPEEAINAFGFDIKGAGVLPVQVIFDNQGENDLEIISSQTFLVDRNSNIWPVLDKGIAYERIGKKTELGEMGAKATKGGVLGAIGGALVGAAVGIVTGDNVLSAAGKGAAVGAASGAVVGGAHELGSGSTERKISEDLRNKSLENSPVRSKTIAHGFIFFPGEAQYGQELRINLKNLRTGETAAISFPL